MRRRLTFLVVLALSAMLAACGTDTPQVRATEASSPFRPCPSGTDVPARPALPAGQSIPAITLPCFTGGQPVNLAELGRPAVINLWASWCPPCRAELPELQRFADAAGDKIAVLGVVTGDTRAKAASAAVDFGVTFPAVFDPDESLRRGLGRSGLPITVFVDATGTMRHVYQAGEILTLSTLEAMAREHLGVVVP